MSKSRPGVTDVADYRERLVGLLVERGIDGAKGLVADLNDDQLDGAYGAVVWWSDMPHAGERAVSTGLLVKKIREGGLAGYKRPHERDEPGGTLALTHEYLANVRGLLLSPDAVMDRAEAEDFYGQRARALNTPVGALIDSAVGPQWRATPPHPAMPRAWGVGWKPLDNHCDLRYLFLVEEGNKLPVDTGLPRESIESDWNYACRFWGWEDPPELRDKITKRLAAEAEAAEAKKAEAEAEAMAMAMAMAQTAPAGEGEAGAGQRAPGAAVALRPKRAAEPRSEAERDERFGADAPWDDPGPQERPPDEDDPW